MSKQANISYDIQPTKSQKMTISAVLTALSLVYLYFMPTFDLGVWSFTLFSHIFLFIACFVSPYTALMTYIASLVSFILKTSNYLIWLRAASHLFWIIAVVLYIRFKGIKSKKDIAITAIMSALIHTILEVLAVILGLSFGIQGNSGFYYLFLALGIGNIVHNTIDFIVALLVHQKVIGKLYRNTSPIKNIQE